MTASGSVHVHVSNLSKRLHSICRFIVTYVCPFSFQSFCPLFKLCLLVDMSAYIIRINDTCRRTFKLLVHKRLNSQQ